jgi:sugar lactone lactonase YvrE
MRRVRVVVLSVLAFGLVLVLAACSSTPTGSLKVTVSGLPAGIDGSVMVTGPGGYSKVVTATTTLSDLELGTYSVAVGSVSNTDAIVPTSYDGSAASSSVAVAANATASTIASYMLRIGSGHLWVPSFGGSGLATSYPGGSLAASGSPSPDVTIAGGTNQAEAVAFDGSGNLWVDDWSGHVYRYDAADLGSTGTPAPSVTISADSTPSLAYPIGLAFDASGNLWVSNYGSGTLVRYTPSQLAASGSPTPSVTISADSTPSLASPTGIAFDASGDLWVANFTTKTLVQYTPSQLAASGSPTPAVTISADSTPSLANPVGLAFDATGNLWVANYTTSSPTVVRFDAAQLASTGNPTPAATIGGGSFSSGAQPGGVALDASGALWVGESGAQQLLRFTNPDALTGSVSPTPDVVLSSVPVADGMMIAFSPPPANLPIHTP